MLESKIVGIFLPVKDVEEATAWYMEKIGFRYLRTETFGDVKQTILLVDEQANEMPWLHLVEQSTHFSPPPFMYVNIYVKHIEDKYKQLKDNGVEVSEFIEEEMHRCFNFKDLDGNEIGFVSW